MPSKKADVSPFQLKLRTVQLPEGLAPSTVYTPERVNQFFNASDMLEAGRQALESEQDRLQKDMQQQIANNKLEHETALTLELLEAIKSLNQQYEEFTSSLLEKSEFLIEHAWSALLNELPDRNIVHRLLNQAREKIDSRAYIEVLFSDFHESDVQIWIASLEKENVFLDHIKFVANPELRKNCIKLTAKRGGVVIFDFREQEISIINVISGLLKSN